MNVPHPLLKEESVQKSLNGQDGPWRRKSNTRTMLGQEMIFEHPTSRTWVKILNDKGHQQIIGIAKRFSDLPKTEDILQQQTFPKGKIAQLEPKLKSFLMPPLEKNKDILGEVQYIMNHYPKSIKPLLEKHPLAVLNQFHFTLCLQRKHIPKNLDINNPFANQRACHFNFFSGMNFNQTQKNEELKDFEIVFELYCPYENSYHDSLTQQSMTEAATIEIAKRWGKKTCEVNEIGQFFPFLLKQGLLWDYQQQKQYCSEFEEEPLFDIMESIDSLLQKAEMDAIFEEGHDTNQEEKLVLRNRHRL